MPVHAVDRSPWLRRLLVGAVIAALIAGTATLLAIAQSNARDGVMDRFAARAALSARFVATYNSQLLARERVVAAATLSGRDPTAAFAPDVRAFAFPAAVLIDSAGRALAVAPSAPQLIGHPIASKYAHLSSALRGIPTVSNVVMSAAQGTPVVAFAAPFQTLFGRRVLSGAYAVRDTPLKAFLDDTTTLKGASVTLVDANSAVVAANGKPLTEVQELKQRDPALAAASAVRSSGSLQEGSTRYYFTKTGVNGTAWTLLISAPEAGVFDAVSGASQWVPWVILVALAVLTVLLGWLGTRRFEGRYRLKAANERLAELVGTDSLTGLSNRRQLTELLTPLLAVRRKSFPVCALMIDVDHFKLLNDAYGHPEGDRALCHVAKCLAGALREGDLLARWGGEEFLAILPATDAEGALVVAERLRVMIESTPYTIDGSPPLTIRISIGLAEATNDTVNELVRRADLALYQAKAAGRNRVVSQPTA